MNRTRKVCFILAMILLLFGICIHNEETDSFFLRLSNGEGIARIMPKEQSFGGYSSATNEMLGRRSQTTRLLSEARMQLRVFSRCMASTILNLACFMPVLFYSHFSEIAIFQKISAQGKAVWYIHNSDGKK